MFTRRTYNKEPNMPYHIGDPRKGSRVSTQSMHEMAIMTESSKTRKSGQKCQGGLITCNEVSLRQETQCALKVKA
jgi:hypothetical protein